MSSVDSQCHLQKIIVIQGLPYKNKEVQSFNNAYNSYVFIVYQRFF